MVSSVIYGLVATVALASCSPLRTIQAETLRLPQVPVNQADTGSAADSLCVVVDGRLRAMLAGHSQQPGVTAVNGRAISEIASDTTRFAAGSTWYGRSERLRLNSYYYAPAGLVINLSVEEFPQFVRAGTYKGLPLLAIIDSSGIPRPDVVFVPVSPPCRVLAYYNQGIRADR